MVIVRDGARGKTYWDARWRYRLDDQEPWRLVQRRRRGRCPDGWLDERAANVAAVAAMGEHARELACSVEERRRTAEALLSVRELARQWLEWLTEVRNAKPSTLADYAHLPREPGEPHRRGTRTSPGRIMAAFGDQPVTDVTSRGSDRGVQQW